MEGLGKALEDLVFFGLLGIATVMLLAGAAVGTLIASPFALWMHSTAPLIPGALTGLAIMAIYLITTLFGWMPKF